MWLARRLRRKISGGRAAVISQRVEDNAFHLRTKAEVICEKKLKGWRRARKIALIEKMNPRWLNLSDEWEQQPKLYDRPWKTEEMI
jgi:predicted GIY-YIG superfamily endonuclease